MVYFLVLNEVSLLKWICITVVQALKLKRRWLFNILTVVFIFIVTAVQSLLPLEPLNEAMFTNVLFYVVK